MANPFVAEIRIFPFNFAPKGWAFCDGQLMAISDNAALFKLVGPTYGGDGKSNFALPNMQGSAPMHPGQGPGLSLHDLGETSGTDTVILIQSEIPSHSHTMMAANFPADQGAPSPARALARSRNASAYVTSSAQSPLSQMSDSMVAPAGGDQPHNNLMP